jgi:hypothetical protein
MRGDVTLTSSIHVTAAAPPGIPTLTWTGGGGSYQVFRDTRPFFPAPLTSLPPDGGAAGTTLTDSLQPAAGGALFYLVMNQ